MTRVKGEGKGGEQERGGEGRGGEGERGRGQGRKEGSGGCNVLLLPGNE